MGTGERKKRGLRQVTKQKIEVSKKGNSHKSSREVDELIRDLQVHQVELQIQNEELLSTREELQRTHDRYADLFDNAPVAYFTINLLTNRIIEVNLTASELLKVSRNYICKSKFIRFIDPEFTDIFHFSVRKTLDEPYRDTCEVKMRRYDNTDFWALVNISRIPQTKQVRITLFDITERKKAEQIKDDFIGMVSHELRTPLTVVLGSIKVAQSDGLTTDELKGLLLEADQGSETLSHILDNLIELSRYQSNRLKLSKARIDIGGVVRDIVKAETGHLYGHPVSLTIPEKLPVMEVDLIRVQRVLHNLLDNAAKYSPEQTEIQVIVKRNKKSILIGVSNPGKGISLEDRSKLFEPFERLRESSTTHPGLGLGLLVCKRLIEAHGGDIWVDSKPGCGTTFWFTLPVT